jgi:hypothetical protein
MAIEIVDFPSNSMVMFDSYVKLPEGMPQKFWDVAGNRWFSAGGSDRTWFADSVARKASKLASVLSSELQQWGSSFAPRTQKGHRKLWPAQCPQTWRAAVKSPPKKNDPTWSILNWLMEGDMTSVHHARLGMTLWSNWAFEPCWAQHMDHLWYSPSIYVMVFHSSPLVHLGT